MTDHEYEPEIVDAVRQVSNRYGVEGLGDLISLAQEEIVVARRALEELEDLGSDSGPAGGPDSE